MKILEIKNTRIGEVAYLYDETRGRIIKVLVDDYTRESAAILRESEMEEYEEELEPRPRPTRKVRVRVQPQVEEELVMEEEEPEPPVRKVPVNQRPVIPPHLRGVFIEPGNPGAAVESRKIG